MPPRAASIASRALLDAALAQVCKKLARTAARFDALGAVTLTCLVGVKVQLGASERETAPFGAPSASCSVFRWALLLFAVDPGDVRLASKTGATADIPEPPLRANSGLMHRSKRRA
jgi:hypothetical protein